MGLKLVKKPSTEAPEERWPSRRKPKPDTPPQAAARVKFFFFEVFFVGLKVFFVGFKVFFVGFKVQGFVI